ncbi:MAG TPA: FAD-linked oxidase C-terminal domain-containing protein [Rubricoccaceae bacterium]|nr:FAD-linked oxidase C-terminal domain-containing protein [Rubricoccaceae bacterium]
MADDTPLKDLAAALRPRVAGDLRLDALHRALYATDGSMYRLPPRAVLLPRHPDDAQAAIEEAGRIGVPVLPRGSGTSLAGSAVADALAVDTTRWLDGIVAIDPEQKTATVEPGVVLDDLNRRLAPHGLRVGPDPASSSRATLGGMLATNATGARSIRYGSVVDHAESAEAILADGTRVRFEALDDAAWTAKGRMPNTEGDLYRRLGALLSVHGPAIRRDTPQHWRRAGGYRLERLLDAPEIARGPGRAWDGTRNVAHLLCGSEGTLAFVTRLTVRLVAKPPHAALGVVHFPSRRAALDAVAPILETAPSAVELLDRPLLLRARAVAEYVPRLHFVRGDPAALLVVEYEGATPAEVREGLGRLRRALGPSAALTEALEGAPIADVWAVRKVGLGLAMSARLPVQAVAFVEDAAVPVERLPRYVEALEAALAEEGLEAVVYAHASAGCLHIRPFLDLKEKRHVEAMPRLARASAELVKAAGGALASEHGDGLARSWLAPDFYGAPLYAAYRAVKHAFDPKGVFNPGKVVDAPPMTAHLRYDPAPRARPYYAALPFTDAAGRDAGFASAAEACNGSAVCRQRHVGTMCPSFMATREEKDSTRGRANALREALYGHLPSLTGPEVAAAMDLCLSCKACKAECPAGVDLAALKAAWLAERWRRERPPFRTRLFAHLPRFAPRISGTLAPAANRLVRSRTMRRRLAALGLAPERPLPAFVRHPFREGAAVPPASGQVVLFADTFTRFFEPEIARAALRVIEGTGAAVVVPPYVCCGRTLFSEGFIDEARRRAGRLAETLAPYAEAGAEIVGLEPSCLLTLRDELRALLPDDPHAALVAKQARLFEEWAAAHVDRLATPSQRVAPRDVLVHGHCHQKALSSLTHSRAMFEALGFDYRETGAGCCGLAGAFGYEADHYGVSLAIAEDRLAPAVRAAPSHTLIVAAGTSCRAQIAHITGRAAHHPAEVLAQAIPRQ